jgi:hypothetical protein
MFLKISGKDICHNVSFTILVTLTVRTALVALIAFFPTKGNGAIGSLDFTKEHRKALALKSVEAPPKYGSAERQKLIDEVMITTLL